MKPYPVADSKFTVKILDLLQHSFHYKYVRVLNNIYWYKYNPIEILMNLPGICNEKNVPYCFV